MSLGGMSTADLIVLLASVVTIISGIFGAVRYFQGRAARPPQYARGGYAPSPYGSRSRHNPPTLIERALPHRGSIVWAAIVMALVPVIVYALLNIITATIVTSKQDASWLGLITLVVGGAGLLAGGIIGGRIAGEGSRALTAMLLAVVLTVLGYILYKALTKQVIYLDSLLNSDLATSWLRSQLLLVIGAIIGGRSARNARNTPKWPAAAPRR